MEKEETKNHKICKMYKKDKETQSNITNTRTGNSQPKKERTQKNNPKDGTYGKCFQKEEIFPKGNFCFKKRILSNGEITQEMTNQDTKGDFQSINRTK